MLELVKLFVGDRVCRHTWKGCRVVVDTRPFSSGQCFGLDVRRRVLMITMEIVRVLLVITFSLEEFFTAAHDKSNVV